MGANVSVNAREDDGTMEKEKGIKQMQEFGINYRIEVKLDRTVSFSRGWKMNVETRGINPTRANLK
jgi:hypothetical protein